MAIQYSLIGNGQDSNITVFVNGEVYVAASTHPNFDAIVAAAVRGDENIADLIDVTVVVSKKLEKLSERVSVSNNRIYFDGDEIDNVLTKQILRFIEEDVSDWKPLVNFFENVAANTNEHSREQLYRWLQERNFTITEDGSFIAYKGVAVQNDGQYVSISHGTAFVNGEQYNGAIPNWIGAEVEMPRSEVTHDPTVGCNTGLHAGTWEYASGFAQGAVLEVIINPRDVVSVPTDCNDSKLRVCRYIVNDVADRPDTASVKFAGNIEDYEDNMEDDHYDDRNCEEYVW